jgi:hypothetical protein
MNTEAINDKNFILFCASHYDNYEYNSTEDFFDDLKRIKYIKKLVTRYVEKGDLKERLILNHIIVLNNCFGAEITAKILFLKLKSRLHYIKPFLIFLNILPETLYNVGGEKIIDTNMVSMDQEIINRLRKIGKGDEENI